MSQHKTLLSHIKVYSIATVLTQLITLAVAVLSRRFLGPMQTGIWAFFQVVLTYASFSAFGITNASTREIPFYIGKKDYAKADQIKNTVFTYATLSSLIVAAGIVAYALFRRGSLSGELFYGYLFVALIVVLQRLNDLLISLLRAYKQFETASKQMIYSSIFNAAAVTILAYSFKLFGYITAIALSLIYNIAYMRGCHKTPLKISWSGGILKEAAVYGFPLMILSSLTSIFLSIDKLMITKYLGFHALGLYGVATLTTEYLTKIPNSINTVLVPNFHEKYGEREKNEDLENYLIKTADAYAVVLSLITAFAWFFAPVAIQWFLPAFTDSIPAVKILSLCIFFKAQTGNYQNFMIAIKKQGLLFPIIGSCCLAAYLLNRVAINMGYGLQGIAAATTITVIFHYLLVYGVVQIRYLNRKSLLRSAVSSGLKFSVMVFYLLTVEYYVQGNIQFMTSVAAYSIFFGLYLPWTLKFLKEFRQKKSLSAA